MSLPSSCRDKQIHSSELKVETLRFLGNGPYSFTLSPGHCLGLTGESGIGKSQLLRAIVDLIPHQGKLFYNGKSSEHWPGPDWRKMICMVPSESFWWFDRVAEHFPCSFTNAPLSGWLKQFGFSTDVANWQVSRLSTGERQRLALLRSLITRPPILLLDEPSSGLDSHFVSRVEELVGKIVRQGASVLWVSHDLEQLARVAHASFVLKKKEMLPLKSNMEEDL